MTIMAIGSEGAPLAVIDEGEYARPLPYSVVTDWWTGQRMVSSPL